LLYSFTVSFEANFDIQQHLLARLGISLLYLASLRAVSMEDRVANVPTLPKIHIHTRSPPRSPGPGTVGSSRSNLSRGGMTPMSRGIGTPASRGGQVSTCDVFVYLPFYSMGSESHLIQPVLITVRLIIVPHCSNITNTSQSTVRSDMSRVTKEDKHAAMMGYKDLNKSVSADGVVSYREEFCGACGIIHSQPDLLHVYTSCKSCHSVLREPAELRKIYYDVPPETPLEVLFATYGDPIDPDFCVDVTDTCDALVKKFTGADRIAFKPALPADKIFGFDPYPGHNKQLRMRYRAAGVHGTLALDFDRDNKIPVPFLMLVPKTRYLRVFHAIYGHPKGASSTGRMSFDVLEIVQALIDQSGGSYLSISSYTPLERLFGDPCPGKNCACMLLLQPLHYGVVFFPSSARLFIADKSLCTITSFSLPAHLHTYTTTRLPQGPAHPVRGAVARWLCELRRSARPPAQKNLYLRLPHRCAYHLRANCHVWDHPHRATRSFGQYTQETEENRLY